MRLIDADALLEGYKHMGYDPTEHPEESYMEGWCKGFNSATDHCMHHVIHAPTVEPAERETTTVTIGKTRGGRTEWYECDNCGAPVHPEDRYCSECGRRLKVPSGDMHENLSYREN